MTRERSTPHEQVKSHHLRCKNDAKSKPCEFPHCLCEPKHLGLSPNATHCEYTPDQQRAAEYIVEISGIGGGDDPVGFLIASHAALRDRLLAEAPAELPSNGAIAHTYGKLKAALKELLRLYDWRNEIGTVERDFNHDKKQVKTWLNQYGREKKVAWAVARDVLTWAIDIDALMLHERIQREAQTRAKKSAIPSAWIPIAKRQPGRWDDVLVCFEHEGKPIVVHGLLRYDGERFTIGLSDCVYPGKVTHWMHLPEAPK